MSDERIQLTWVVPPHYADEPKAIEYMNKDGERKFAEALFDWVAANGGGIVGPIHRTERVQDDWLFKAGTYRTYAMFCNVTALPKAPEFKMLGGPHDGHIMQTGGISPWRVPMPPPIPSVLAYGEDPTRPQLMYAEYERITGTQGYRFIGVRP